jgi:beta-galactosidase
MQSAPHKTGFTALLFDKATTSASQGSISNAGGRKMSSPRKVSGNEPHTLTTAGENVKLRRRDALKSLVATLTAGPLMAEKIMAGQQHRAAESEHPTADAGRNQSFDADWRFHLGDVSGAESPDFDDAAWRRLDLPHDWSVENLPHSPDENGHGAVWGGIDVPLQVGPFDMYHSEGKRDTGWFVGGTGWYRKRFRVNGMGQGSQAEILFDGVYMNSDVWLNGHYLGNHPYGYTSFAYDLTPYIKRDGENVVAVRVRNEGRNSRWYSGSGIYRHVWLNVTKDIRVPTWGIYVTTPQVSAQSAAVAVAFKVENLQKVARQVTVRVWLLDSRSRVAGNHASSQEVPAASHADVKQTIAVSTPQLWSPATPHLYRAEIELATDGKTVDRVSTTFGIRKVEVDAQNGLRINGEAVKLRGGCMHHANGLLGSAAIDRADERRVELMKNHGFNAIRCAHNPPSPAFLDACDRLGVVVIDEAFDQWSVQKNPQDYHLYFKEWWRRDIDSMVLRDRNHPSIIFWSVGNEIPERAKPEGVVEAQQIVEEIKRLDDTRPITAAVDRAREGSRIIPWREMDPAFKYLNVAGYNYQWEQYEKDHARLPDRVIMGTESFPLQAFENWHVGEQNACVIGDFVWTGMDYLGESGIGNAQLDPYYNHSQPPAPKGAIGGQSLANFSLIFADYPWFSAYCGDIDLIGEIKPQFYYKRVLWDLTKLEMAVQRPIPPGRKQLVSAWGWPDELKSWTWPGHEGRPLSVQVYTKGDQVRLLLNGHEVGTKPVSVETKFRAEFEVPYAAGELKAVALKDGKPIAEMSFRTAGKPARLRLKADRQTIRASRNDLAYVTLEVLDGTGRPVPDATVPVSFSISGEGELAAAGTANPKDVRSFRNHRPVTYHGKCLAIVRPIGRAGTVTLRAKSEGLEPVSATLKVG